MVHWQKDDPNNGRHKKEPQLSESARRAVLRRHTPKEVLPSRITFAEAQKSVSANPAFRAPASTGASWQDRALACLDFQTMVRVPEKQRYNGAPSAPDALVFIKVRDDKRDELVKNLEPLKQKLWIDAEDTIWVYARARLLSEGRRPKIVNWIALVTTCREEVRENAPIQSSEAASLESIRVLREHNIAQIRSAKPVAVRTIDGIRCDLMQPSGEDVEVTYGHHRGFARPISLDDARILAAGHLMHFAHGKSKPLRGVLYTLGDTTQPWLLFSRTGGGAPLSGRAELLGLSLLSVRQDTGEAMSLGRSVLLPNANLSVIAAFNISLERTLTGRMDNLDAQFEQVRQRTAAGRFYTPEC
jgi:hypothetical protein